MTRYGLILAGALVMATAQSALAAEDAPVCTAPGTLPPGLLAWTMLAYRDAATGPATVAAARLTLGEAARVTLPGTAAVTYPLHPEKPGTPDSYGGLLQFVITARGTYRIVLGSRAWIDVVTAKGVGVASAAHAMGPACTGIRKMVDFALAPGTYTLQLSGNAETAVSVLVIRLP